MTLQGSADWMPTSAPVRRDPLQFIGDTWSGLGYKRAMDAPDNALIHTWIGSHWRRITAYKLLSAIFQNRARAFLDIADATKKAKHREYGDAALIVQTVRSAVTGDDVSIVIDGMEEGDVVAQARLDWLEQWSADERMPAKVLETERDTCRLGDGVYMIAADPVKGRPRLRLFDAGFYFPELDPNSPEDEFPTTIHIAWQYEATDDKGRTDSWIRRMTWTLGPILPLTDGGVLRRPTLRQGDTQANGTITRVYPWATEPSSVTCYFTDGRWRINDLPENATIDTWRAWGRATSYELDEATGAQMADVDLQKDYIPVVHLPNTVAIKEHFGESVLMAIAQLLDELAAADTDSASAAALAGLPVVGASGTTATNIEIVPGKVIGLGPDGKLTPLDLSASLEACMKYVDFLIDRATVNARLTNEATGRVDAADIKSGLHLALSWGPMRSLIEELRLARAEKNPLVLKFVQREAISQGWLTKPVQPATLAYGSFLPADKAATIEAVTKLYAAHLISRQTAIKWLVDEGIVDLDVAKELKACEQEDFDRLIAKLEALGGGPDAIDEVWRDLGIKRPTPEPAPVGNGIPSNTPPSNTTGSPEVDPQTGAPVLDLGA